MKICKLCNAEKDECEFYKSRLECKVCTKEKHKEYRVKNKDKIKKQQDLTRDERNAKRRNITEEERKIKNEKRKEYRQNNKERETLKNKQNNKKYKQRIDNYNKNYYASHKENKRKYNKKYKYENREKIKEQKILWKENKKKTDPYYVLVETVRARIRSAFKYYSKNGKVKSCKEYGIDFGKIFDKVGPRPGSGKEWHLDHIIPLCLFNLDNPHDVYLSHIPENLQWMSGIENLEKGKVIKDETILNIKLLEILIYLKVDISNNHIIKSLSMKN